MIQWLIDHYAEIAVWSAIIGLGLGAIFYIGLFILEKIKARKNGTKRHSKRDV